MAVIPHGKRGRRYALREDLGLDAIARLWWFHRWILMASALIGGSFAFFFFSSQNRLYEATVLIEVNVAEEQVLGAKLKEQKNEEASRENVEDIIVFLSSNFLLGELVDELDLQSDDEFFSTDEQGDLGPARQVTGPVQGNRQFEEVSNPAFTERAQVNAAIVANLLDHLSIGRVGGSNVISIAATSASSAKAARIANSIAALYLEHQHEMHVAENARAITVLKDRIERLRGEVLGLEGQIVAYRIDHQIEYFDEGRPETNAIAVQRGELSTQLALIKVGLAEAKARRLQFTEKPNDSDGREATPTILISPVLRELRAAETDVLRRRSQLSAEYGAQHPLMVNLTDELATLHERMWEEVAKISQNLDTEVSVNLARAAELEAQIALLDLRSSTQQQAQIGLLDLKQRSETSRVLLEDLLKRHHLRVQQQDLDIATARVMSPASIPTGPVYPQIALFSLMAAAVTMLIACLGTFFYERWVADFGFVTMDQLRDFDLTPLGVIPDLKLKEADGETVEDYALLHRQSMQSEALQRIRTKLHHLDATSDKLGQVLLMTSSMPLEGKTTTSVILARQAAEAGFRTLLIDADLRRPRAHEALGVGCEVGLAEILMGKSIEGELIRRDPVTPLQFLAAGQHALSPADLFRSQRMSSLMTELRQHFGWIVIDSPPIGAVTDSLVLSAHADVCVLVARWRETTRSTIMSSVSQLQDVHAPLAGVILSRVNVTVQAKHGDADFGQYYGHYQDRPAHAVTDALRSRPEAA